LKAALTVVYDKEMRNVPISNPVFGV